MHYVQWGKEVLDALCVVDVCLAKTVLWDKEYVSTSEPRRELERECGAAIYYFLSNPIFFSEDENERSHKHWRTHRIMKPKVIKREI